jgi:signal transducing adaptor molecule
MPIFGESTTPYDEAVEKVTAETMTSENWALIMDICDRVSATAAEPTGLKQAVKQCLLSVKKRFH